MQLHRHSRLPNTHFGSPLNVEGAAGSALDSPSFLNLIDGLVYAFVRVTRQRGRSDRKSDRLENNAWKRKRVLAFACHIKYGWPAMKQQSRCPRHFI